ncbi:LCP family protein [Latilactobacillus sp. 5-91]|uniref:LCP family protein n=1 Tax=Latilactobacillus sp. 5-91 TaxID=3410924 RepID=UPI003C70774F
MQNSNFFGSREDKYKKSKRHRKLKIFLLIIAIIAFSGGAYAMRVSSQLKSAADKINKSEAASKAIKNKKAFSILLLGVDTGAEGRIDKGNSDTMIVATVNPKKEQVKLVSIPRDTLAELQGTKTFNMQKINAAYNVGGSKMAKKTVEKMFDVPIDYYVTINMGALSKIVDAVGGVDVNVPFSFKSNGSTFTKGKMHLNGKKALDYSRMRYEDPDGDYGRQKRQRQVITSLVGSAISFKSLTNFESILKTLEDSVATDLSFDDMVAMQSNYRSTAKNITSDYLKGRNATIEGSSYQVPTTSEIQRVSDVLRTSLGLEKTNIDNAETKQNALNTNFTTTEYQDEFTIYPESVLKDGTTTSEAASTTTTQDNTTQYSQSAPQSNWQQPQQEQSQWQSSY